MENTRQPSFEVVINPQNNSIIVRSVNGQVLNDRAMRDIGRMQWIAINRGWIFTFNSDNLQTRQPISAEATFLNEEFISARRYFEFVNQGILITEVK
jgi:hypothetical protein